MGLKKSDSAGKLREEIRVRLSEKKASHSYDEISAGIERLTGCKVSTDSLTQFVSKGTLGPPKFRAVVQWLESTTDLSADDARGAVRIHTSSAIAQELRALADALDSDMAIALKVDQFRALIDRYVKSRDIYISEMEKEDHRVY